MLSEESIDERFPGSSCPSPGIKTCDEIKSPLASRQKSKVIAAPKTQNPGNLHTTRLGRWVGGQISLTPK